MKNFQHNCDCKMVWFLRRLKQKKFRSKLYKPSNIGKCVSPKRLVNKRVQDITEEDVCPQLPRKGTIQLTCVHGFDNGTNNICRCL